MEALVTIESYVNHYEGEKREWISEFTSYMRDKHPFVPGTIWFRMPTYKMGDFYLAFSITKRHFTFHTNDPESLLMVKEALPKATYGKRSIHILYRDLDAKRVIFNVVEYMVYKSRKV